MKIKYRGGKPHKDFGFKKVDWSQVAGTKQERGEHEYVSEISLAVRPDQVDEANRVAVKRGGGYWFDKQGHCHMGKSAKESDAVAKKLGLVNLSGAGTVKDYQFSHCNW